MAGYDDNCRATGVGMGTPRGPQRQAAARARAVIGGQLLTVSIETGRLDCGVVHLRPTCLARSRGFINCNDMITRQSSQMAYGQTPCSFLRVAFRVRIQSATM